MDSSNSTPHRSSERRTTLRASPLSRIGEITAPESLRISLDLDQSPTTAKKPTPSSPTPLSLLRSPTRCFPLRELLLMSPPSSRKSKPRFDDEMHESNSLRRRCRAALSSPRNSRRSRRRQEVEVREEKEIALMDEAGKQRKRRNSGRNNKKDKLSLVPFQPPSEEENGGELDRIGMLIAELIMWNDVQKSTFWFGFGSLCFLSSCFTKGINFSIFSGISQLAILFLAVSFISNSVCQRDPEVKQMSYAKLKEDDVLRLAKLILPALNFAISKMKGLFCGEPSMTLKVAPFLLLGAQYGHLITIWRLSAIGFFVSFSVPKLYSCYSVQINQRAECLKLRLLDTWNACSYKKIVIVSALITFWNLSSIKTRICTGFLLVVIFRYIRQNVLQKVEDGEAYAADKEQRQVSLVAEPVDEKPHQTLLVAA